MLFKKTVFAALAALAVGATVAESAAAGNENPGAPSAYRIGVARLSISHGIKPGAIDLHATAFGNWDSAIAQLQKLGMVDVLMQPALLVRDSTCAGCFAGFDRYKTEAVVTKVSNTLYGKPAIEYGLVRTGLGVRVEQPTGEAGEIPGAESTVAIKVTSFDSCEPTGPGETTTIPKLVTLDMRNTTNGKHKPAVSLSSGALKGEDKGIDMQFCTYYLVMTEAL